jgi:hypothetical protein
MTHQPDDIATEVARKIAATRRIIGRATDENLERCIAGYSTLDNDAARAIVRFAQNELTARAAESAGGEVVWRFAE